MITCNTVADFTRVHLNETTTVTFIPLSDVTSNASASFFCCLGSIFDLKEHKVRVLVLALTNQRHALVVTADVHVRDDAVHVETTQRFVDDAELPHVQHHVISSRQDQLIVT